MRSTLILSLFLAACAAPTSGTIDEPTPDPEPPAPGTQQLAVCAAGDGELAAGWSVDNGHGAVSALSVNGAGSVALAGADGTIKLWDITSGALDWSSDNVQDPSAVYGSEMPTDGPLNALDFDETGTLIVGGDDNGVVGQWTAETGLAHAAWTVGTEPVTAVAQAMDGQLLASATSAFGGELRTWFECCGPEGDPLTTDLWFVNALQIDDEVLIAAGDIYGEPTVELRSSAFPTAVMGLAILRGITGTVVDVARLDDGRVLGAGPGFLAVFDAELEEGHTVLRTGDEAWAAVALLDSEHFAAATEDGQVHVGRLEDLQTQSVLETAPVTSLAAVPGGWQLAASGDDGVLRLVDCEG